ncbi:MAG: hypothetical protein M1831_006138 [Alyxoria varia]|nr:MAG: hypothetical protein M1831_006138 [Alyxoria varia]
MSDDEMDVDGGDAAPDLSDAMAFRGGAAEKGKRSAANLPVEVGDNMPWVEKYRPNTMDDVQGHKDVLATIEKFVEKNRLPHLLLYGPPGTGKTSTVLALARRIYGNKNMRQMVLELNASDDRGIDVVREQIKTFSSTKQIFNSFAPAGQANGTSDSKEKPLTQFKLIILDEADAMTSTAQMALRRIMEKYTPNTRFCILANYTHKLSPALLSRCTRFRFSPLREPAVRKMVEHVIAKEDVKINEDAVAELIRCAKGDMRRALNVLQASHASTLPMPDSEGSKPPADKQPEEERETITPHTIHTTIASPPPELIYQIRDLLLETPSPSTCLRTLLKVKKQNGLALQDILTALSEELGKLEVPARTRIVWTEGLAEVEWRVSSGGGEDIQTGAMVGVIRSGVEAWDKGKSLKRSM